MEEYRKSTDYVNSNIDGAAQIMEDEGIFKAAIAKKQYLTAILHLSQAKR